MFVQKIVASRVDQFFLKDFSFVIEEAGDSCAAMVVEMNNHVTSCLNVI